MEYENEKAKEDKYEEEMAGVMKNERETGNKINTKVNNQLKRKQQVDVIKSYAETQSDRVEGIINCYEKSIEGYKEEGESKEGKEEMGSQEGENTSNEENRRKEDSYVVMGSDEEEGNKQV